MRNKFINLAALFAFVASPVYGQSIGGYIPPTGSGTVTSVGVGAIAGVTTSGGAVTTAGSVSQTLNSQTANTVFAAPNGSAGAPTFRAMLPADLGSQTANSVLVAPNGSAGNPTFRALAIGDIGNSGATPHVATNAALTALSTATAPSVIRDAYAANGDAPSLRYYSSGSACSLNAGAGDGGSQIASADSKCWLADFPATGVDVRAFGAKCDGATNDTTAIQNAINYSGNANSIAVIIPASASGCVASVSITAANNIPIRGNGWTTIAAGGSKLKAPNLTSSVLTIGTVGGISVEGVLFIGNATAASSYTSSVPPLIYLNGASGGNPNNVTFKNVGAIYGYDAVTISNAGAFRWIGGSVRDFTHSAVHLTGTGTGSFDNYFYGMIFDQDDATWQNQNTLIAGFWADQNGGSITIDGSDILHSHVGFLAAPGNSQFVIWPFISNTYFDTCDYTNTTATGAVTKTTTGAGGTGTNTYVPGAAGISLSPTGTGIVYGAMLSNVWTATCGIGINIVGTATNSVDTVDVSNWLALNNGGSTLYAKYAQNINISNAAIGGGGQLTPQTTYPGFEFDTGANNVQVTNSRIGAPIQGYSNTMKFGLQFDAGFTGNAHVNNANTSGNFVAGLYLGTSTTSGIDIRQSQGINPGGASSISVGASPFTYTAGVSPENVFMYGGTVSNVSLAGTSVCLASPCTFALNPGQSVQVTYTVAPTMNKNVQ